MPACHAGGREFESRPDRKKPQVSLGAFLFSNYDGCFMEKFYVYIIFSQRFNKYYRGYSKNPCKRLFQYNNKESRYTKHFTPWEMIHLEAFDNKSEAIKRENAIKKYSKSQISELAKSNKNVLGQFQNRGKIDKITSHIIIPFSLLCHCDFASLQKFFQMKKVFLFITLLTFILLSCGENHQYEHGSDQEQTSEIKQFKIQGNAQGTTYHITYFTNKNLNLKPAVDSLLHQIDLSLSGWLKGSLINQMNSRDTNQVVIHDTNNYITTNFKKAREVYVKTNGAFDPTVGPIVNLYGFGSEEHEGVNEDQILEKKQYVGFEFNRVRLTQYDSTGKAGPVRLFYRSEPEIQLDFNGIAQGFSVDELKSLFEENNVHNFMIELGGEIITRSKKPNGESWKIGIDKPVDHDEQRALQVVLTLDDKAVATSGSYRKYIEKDGKKYSHTIDPHTGLPVTHNLVSVTVVSDYCIDADAYGTAFLVMGTEKIKAFLKENADLGLEAFLIYREDGKFKTWNSTGLNEQIENIE